MTIGIVVQTGSQPGGNTAPPTAGANYFVAGMTERGDVTAAVSVTSMADYSNKLGNRVSYGFLFDDLTTFFNEGGQQAYVARVVGPAATAGNLTLADQSTGGGAPTLLLTANNPGTWSTQLTVEVIASGATPAPGGFPNTFSLILRLNGQTVEEYLNMPSPASLATAMTTSQYIVCTNLGSITNSPLNQPATLGPAGVGTALSAGSDDRGDVSSSSYVAALNAVCLPDFGSGACAIPGQSGAVIGQQLMTHGIANSRICITAPPQGQTPSQAESVAISLLTVTNPEYIGVFWPWTLVPDGMGGQLTTPPDGFVAGTRARQVQQNGPGPWRANFGDAAAANWVVGTELALSAAQSSEVYGALVNPLRVIANRVEVYGWESLSQDPNYHFLTGRDVLNYLAASGQALLEQYVGASIDGKGVLFSNIESTLRSLVTPLAAAGGLYPLLDANGNQVDPGWSIDTSASVNPPASLAQGIVNATLGVRVAPSAQLIKLVISIVGFSSSL